MFMTSVLYGKAFRKAPLRRARKRGEGGGGGDQPFKLYEETEKYSPLIATVTQPRAWGKLI